MAPLKWKAVYSVGDPAIDHEHQELVELVNTTASAILDGQPGADIDGAFGDLYRAISSHFALEEEEMRRSSYDQLAPHKADHERLLDQLRDIMDTHDVSSEMASTAVVAAIEKWFSEHFRTHDARLHRKR